MRKMYKVFFSFFLLLTTVGFIGCGENTPHPTTVNGKPDWILHPSKDGKIGAVGIAGRGYDLRVSTQRKLAIQRALDELASTRKVNVQLSMSKEENFTQGQNHLQMHSQSKYQANTTLTAHIEDMWEDKLTGELYIWLVLDK